MKTRINKLLSLLLICIMVLGMLPVTASASENDLITGAYLDAKGTESAKVTKSENTLAVFSYMAGGNIQLPVYDIAVPEGTEKVYVEYSGFTPSGSGDYYNADGSADYSTYFSTSETTPYLGVPVTSLLGTGKFLAVYNNSWTAVVAVRFVVAEPELSYELRTLTFEDSDYKGGTNFAGKQDWSSLIDDPQYCGKMLYGSSGSGVSNESEAYTWYDANNTELKHTISEAYGSWCYWTGGHAVSNYVSGDVTTYGDFRNQLTVFKKDVTGLATTGGGHNGSNNFAMHFGYTDNSGYSTDVLPAISFADGVARVIDHMYVNNCCYAINCYVNGNDLTANIGESDWVKIVATGYDAYGGTTTAEIYLCNGPDNIVMDWTKWDLSGLGAVTKVEFNITGSSDNGYGFSQPAYFAYDDLAVRFEKEPPVEVTGVTLDQAEAAVEVGSTVTLTATVKPENATDKAVKWSSSDETIATVADGVVTGVARGEATITVKAGKFEATCVITVSNAVDATGVALDKTELSMARWTTETLTATVEPEDANEKTVIWSSSDEKVASVVDGVITANCEGTVTITATTTDGGFTATCAVTVTDTEKPDKDDDGYYIIDSAADLMWFAKHVNSVTGTNTDNAKMTCDIDLSTEVGSGLGNWVPIGDADVNASYGGTFDGGNFTISGMYYKNGTDKYAGLFGHTKGATVKNLTIANATFERSKSYAGAFIGFAENTTVENCHNSLYLKGIGSGNSYYAGIIGYAIDCTVRNSSNDGCGHNDCELKGSATICPQPGKIQGSANCGGIIGYAEGTTVVENCVNSGYVYGWGGGHNGGIIGKISGNAAITNCYNTGRMNTYASYAHVYIGGIAGHISSGASANITNCYSSGLLYASSSLSASYKHIASIVALNDGTLTAENCYYLDTQAADENATAKTAKEMYDLANTLGKNYQTSCPTPVLTWQSPVNCVDEDEDCYCDKCGAYCHEHDYSGVVTVAPTCEEKGIRTFTCECSDQYTEEIPAIGHDWDEGEITKRPTYTSTGVKTYTCKNDSSHTKTEVLDKLTVVVTPSKPIVKPVKPAAPKMIFTDVTEADWFYDSVKQAYENGLIDGMSATTFDPNGKLTIAQAIKLAAALHQLEKSGKVTLKNGSDVWYNTYVDYAIANDIIGKSYGELTDAQMNAAATRSEFVAIFHGAKDFYAEKNSVADNAIPDVKLGDKNAAAIYEFYRAGILTGSDAAGTFHPDNSIKRSEVAAILIRMFDLSARQSVSLQ